MVTLTRTKQRVLQSALFASALVLVAVPALAQAIPTVRSGVTGEQISTVAFDAMSTGGTLAGSVCYFAAGLCFAIGVWALWASRQPHNRESGYMIRGIALLVLCAAYISAGLWIDHSFITV